MLAHPSAVALAVSLPGPLGVWLQSLAVDGARYVLAAGAAFLVFWRWGRERFRHRLIQGVFPAARRMLHDAGWSASTVVIFSLVGVGVYYGGRAGVLRRYTDVREYGWAWLGASVVVLAVLQDTYFYWAHRAMHHRLLYRALHRVHHRSTNPSPWTAYAFAPGEALVHAAFVPLVWAVLPLHDAAVFGFLAFMIAFNVHGHLSMELRAPGTTRRLRSGWQATTTHHALHHQSFRYDYGLYFTFWDRVMGTQHPRYHEAFERVAGAPRPAEGLRGQPDAGG